MANSKDKASTAAAFLLFTVVFLVRFHIVNLAQSLPKHCIPELDALPSFPLDIPLDLICLFLLLAA